MSKRLFHIMVDLPLFSAGLNVALEAVVIFDLLELFFSDRVFCTITRIELGSDEKDWHIRALHLDFRLEVVNALKRVSVVDCDAEHEAVGAFVDECAMRAKHVVSTRVNHLNVQASVLEFALPTENIEHARGVLFVIIAGRVVGNQAGLTDRGRATQNYSDATCATI